MGNWLQFDLAMSPGEQSSFYSSIFIPFTLKPLYVFISEHLPIRRLHRKPYIIACCLIATASWFMIAWLVHSPLVALGVMIMQSTANACADMLLGLMIVDWAAKDPVRAGALQSAVESVQSFASLLALLVGLPLYPCDDTSKYPLEPTRIFLITGCISIISTLCSFFLFEIPFESERRGTPFPLPFSYLSLRGEMMNDGRVDTQGSLSPFRRGRDSRQSCTRFEERLESHAEINQEEQLKEPLLLRTSSESLLAKMEAQANDKGGNVLLQDEGHDHADSSVISSPPNISDDEIEPLLSAQPAVRHSTQRNIRDCCNAGHFPVLQLLVPALLVFLLWASLKPFLGHQLWLNLLGGVLALDLTLVVLIWRSHRGACHSLTLRQFFRKVGLIWPALVLFLVNAVPSAEDSLFSYQVTVWKARPCLLQYLSIASDATAMASGCLYFCLFHGWSGHRLIVLFAVSGLLVASSQLLWWPWVVGDIMQEIAGGSQPSFNYAVMATIASEFVAQCFLISSLVLATQASPRDHRNSFIYVLYLSFIDIGDSVSGWVTTPIINALDITLTNYSGLTQLLWICAGSLTAALFLSPLLTFSPLHSDHVVNRELEEEEEVGERGRETVRDGLPATLIGSQ